jgi:ABC-type multidrug transport system fused ATPase/permease subunit
VEPNAFTRVRRDFLRAPVQKWGAILSSVGVAITYVLLLVILYLFVDLLVWKGEVPDFTQLSAARKQRFADEWAGWSETDRADAVRRLNLSPPLARTVAEDQKLGSGWDPVVWESRWRAGVYLILKHRVNDAAADAYLPAEPRASASPPQLGILSLVVRERDRWGGAFGRIVGNAASWNGWTWRWGGTGRANETYLAGLFFLAFAIAAVRGILLNAVAFFAARATLDTVTRIRRAVYFHTFRLGSLAVRSLGTAEAVSIFTRQVETIGEAVYAWVSTTGRHALTFALLLVFILLVNFWLALSFLMLAVLVWLIGGQVAAYFGREARAGSRHADSTLALLRESIGLLRLVKCFQMERFNQNRVERQLAESARANWRKLRGASLSRPLLASVALLAGVALMYLAARAVLNGEFTVAGLVVTAVALASLVPPVAGWFDARARIRRGREAAGAVFEFLDRKGDAAEAPDAEFLPALSTRMEFRSVTLREAGTGRLLLENVSFAIPAGTSIAVVGTDPTEKLALMYLIPRFLDPTSGEIRIEDKNIRWVTHESLRAQVAVVMQDDLTFTDTVANNIRCGDPTVTLPQVIEAAKLAHAHQFIERLPHGYETQIGDAGYSLRPGERFRIALARALLRDPSILIIEEPFGPIDDDTLALLDDTLERVRHGRTVIYLANRLSTLRRVDRVFLLKDGHLEASGSHRDLWQNNDLYRRLQVLADATAESAAIRDEE